VNPQMAALLGYETEEMLGRVVSDFIFEEDLVDFDARMRERREGQPGHYQRRFRRKDGGEVWTSASLTSESGPEGEYLGSFGMFTDVTEMGAAAEEVRRMALAVDTAPNSITVHDFDGRFLYANQRTFELHGYSRDEFLALNLRQLDVPVAEELIAARMQELHERGEASFEAAHFRKDGMTLPVDIRAEVTTWGGKEAILSVATDLTEHKQAEENQARLNQQNELILRSAAEGILGLDSQGNHTFVNPAAARMLGYGAEELLGRPSHSTWHHTKPDGNPYPREECEIYAAYRDGAVHRTSTEVFWRKDGTSFPVEYASTPTYEQGRLAGAVVTFADITERKRAEEDVRRQAEQLRRTVEGAVLAMSHVVETRDPYTAGHERRVAELATAIAEDMGMDGEELDALRHAGLIHDVGKIAVPAEILAKPGRLSEVEFNLIKQHPAAGFDILAAIDFGRPVAEIVLQHHERLDGSGYPRGLSGADILPEARILAVADVVEAMSSHRPYRAALGMEAALAEIREHAGVKYDADVAAACVRLVEEQGFQFTP